MKNGEMENMKNIENHENILLFDDFDCFLHRDAKMMGK